MILAPGECGQDLARTTQDPATLRRFFSSGERQAIEALRLELRLSRLHRQGLRRIRQASWWRPARINLGSGTHVKEGFLNVDLLPGGDLTLDLRRGLPFESGCCEMILSEHFFEHIEYPEPAVSLFRECHRVLRPGGVLRFSVPDTQWPLENYAQGDDAPYFRACREQGWHPPACQTRLEHINYHFRQDGEHRFAYDEETASKALRAAGFTDVRRDAFDPALDSPHREVGSLFMRARRTES